jgi:hypothetical protein
MKIKQIVYILLITVLMMLNSACTKNEDTAEQKAEERQARQDEADKKLSAGAGEFKPPVRKPF